MTDTDLEEQPPEFTRREFLFLLGIWMKRQIRRLQEELNP